MKDSTTGKLVDHLFRNQAGKMTAVLTRIFGIHNLSMAEDVVQEAFLKAAQTWVYDQLPDNPEAWLMQTARNKAIDIIRRQQQFHKYSKEFGGQLEAQTHQFLDEFFLETELADSQLRLIFACCHPQLKSEDQVALTLKTISGFGVKEIARALLLAEATVQKRIFRAKEFLKTNSIQLEIPSGAALTERLGSVHMVLYLLFNEGYNSTKADELIRYDLCAEAMRLTLLLIEHPLTSTPAGLALLSLMCFHSARFESRINNENEIILLANQDRAIWNHELINRGYYYLNLACLREQATVYHLEAAIAAEHCLAPSFAETNWERLLELYNLLLRFKNNPIVTLNKAVVLAQLNRNTDAIAVILSIQNIQAFLDTHYIFNAVLGDLYLGNGNRIEAEKHLSLAEKLTHSLLEKKLLKDKLKTLQN